MIKWQRYELEGFLARMDMSERHINGEIQFTPDIAVRLEMILGIFGKFRNNLEAR